MFQCSELLKLYCESIVPALGATPYFVAILNSRDEPLLLMPWSIEQRYGVRVLRFLDGGLSELNAPVIFPAAQAWDRETTELVWKNLQKVLLVDLAILEKMPAAVGDLPNPLLFLSASKDHASSHVMTLDNASLDAIFAGLPQRRTEARKRRRLSEQGTVEFKLAETPEHYDEIVEALRRQKTRRYQETRGVDGLDRPGYLSFLESGRAYIHESGPVRLFALSVGDTIIAALLGFVARSRFYYFMPSFEGGKWRAYGPGRILLHETIEWCLRKGGLDTFDFGVGDEDYKQLYCDVWVPLYRAEIPVTMRGRLYLKSRYFKYWLSMQAKQAAGWLRNRTTKPTAPVDALSSRTGLIEK